MRSVGYITLLTRKTLDCTGARLHLAANFPGQEGGQDRPARVSSLSGIFIFGSLALAACGEVPVARTNCWSASFLETPEVTQAVAGPALIAGAEIVSSRSTCD